MYSTCTITMITVTPSVCLCVLSLCRYGSIADYLVSAGFTLEEQQKLKDIFLETLD